MAQVLSIIGQSELWGSVGESEKKCTKSSASIVHLKAMSHDSTCWIEMLNQDLLCSVNTKLQWVYRWIIQYIHIGGQTLIKHVDTACWIMLYGLNTTITTAFLWEVVFWSLHCKLNLSDSIYFNFGIHTYIKPIRLQSKFHKDTISSLWAMMSQICLSQ